MREIFKSTTDNKEIGFVAIEGEIEGTAILEIEILKKERYDYWVLNDKWVREIPWGRINEKLEKQGYKLISVIPPDEEAIFINRFFRRLRDEKFGKWSSPLSYLMCSNCKYVTKDMGLERIDIPCPKCHASGEAREIFPGSGAARVLDKIGSFYEKHEYEVVVILFCTLFEILLEEFLENVLVKKRTSMEVRELIFKETKNRIKLFKELIGQSFKEAIKETELKEYYDKWIEIKEKRNKFIHGKIFFLGPEIAKESFKLAKSSFSLFGWLHNKYIYEGG